MFAILNRHLRGESAPVEVREFQPQPDASEQILSEVALHLPLMEVLRKQLQGTASQIEEAVVGVCTNFQEISDRARNGVSRASAFLSKRKSQNEEAASIEDLIGQSRSTFDSLLATLARSAEISNHAIRHMQEIDSHAQKINEALKSLGEIADGNHILALNARIEAARAGEFGKGFEVVATEVVTQTGRSHKVIDGVSQTIQQLRSSASSALAELKGMSERGLASAEVERKQVEETLQAFNDLDQEMRGMLEQASEDSSRLSHEIRQAVNGMQFQDRVNQRLDHVAEAILASEERLSRLCDKVNVRDTSFMDEILSRYTMHEERSAADHNEAEASAGDVELF